MTTPNQSAAGKAGIARLLTSEHLCPGMPDLGRSATKFMRVILSFLLTAVILLSGCGRPSSDTETAGNALPLSFYVVSDEMIEGGQFIDTPDFPKLGYIANSPDLVVTRLEAVVADVSQQREIMVDTNGKRTVMPMQTRPALTIQMSAKDARKFSTLTEQAVGKRVLLMLGDTPLIAPTVQAPISTPRLILTLGEQTDQKRVEDELKKLVR